MKTIITLILSLISTNVYGDTVVENFNSNPGNRWQFFTDQVMGGKSNGKLEFFSEENNHFARMTGDVSIKNNGGFIQFRADIIEKFDNSFKGIKLKVRGNNQNYFIHIRTTGSVLPWQYYDKEFFASNEWNEVELNFSDFKKSSTFMRKKFKASSIKTIGIVAYGREHKAKIEVSEISIY